MDGADVQRLDKVLSNSGFGSRSKVKKLVKAGMVAVNGKTAKDASTRVDASADIIEVNGCPFIYKRFIYIMMNKAAGVVSTTYEAGRQTVLDPLPEKYARFKLFPAGRLDADAEGLIILTNDGWTAHEIISPARHVNKRYYVLVDGKVTPEDAGRFREGIVLDEGYRTKPADLVIINAREIPGDVSRWRSEAEVVIHEGKFHQVKRMFKALGKKVIYLKRVQIGDLKLDERLGPGEWREMTPEEIELAKRQAADEAPLP